MSDSESLSDSAPADSAMEEALRSIVQNIYKKGNLEDLTVKRVRAVAEKQLELEKDFFKDHTSWKEKSKTIIQAEVVCAATYEQRVNVSDNNLQEAHPEPASSQASPPNKPSKKLPPKKSPGGPTKSAESDSRVNGKKRSSPEAVGPQKRRKKEASDGDLSSSAGDKEDHERTSPKTTASKIRSPPPNRNLVENDGQEEPEDDEVATANGGGVAASGSEMSEVIDEGPKPKRKRRSEGSEKPKVKKSAASKPERSSTASKPEPTADPDADEIKRLQGWLVRCGIRKMWWKELKPYDTPKAKIRHLKDMLSEAGMTGRPSIEKATQIKEERELKADLEAVQAGAQKWGKAGSEDEATGRPKRRLAKGLAELDFLNDDDGEESD